MSFIKHFAPTAFVGLHDSAGRELEYGGYARRRVKLGQTTFDFPTCEDDTRPRLAWFAGLYDHDGELMLLVKVEPPIPVMELVTPRLMLADVFRDVYGDPPKVCEACEESTDRCESVYIGETGKYEYRCWDCRIGH